jgi:radical SAM superfamily enzyme YgiQ (UPF0313 family)
MPCGLVDNTEFQHMRALLINPKSDFAFWTLPESARFSGSKALVPPLGLLTVAALLPNDWELRLLDRNFADPTEDDWRWADIVMITGIQGQNLGMLASIREAKARKKTVVVGGPYATSTPHEFLDAGADFVARGEGERNVPLLLEALAQGTAGKIIESPDRPEMSESPTPRFDLVNFSDYQILLVQTSRGCPFECEFCDIISLFGRKPRYKKPEQLIAELQAIYDLGWRGTIFIGDDNFIGSRNSALALLEGITSWQKAHGEPFGFVTQASVNLGKDLEMIDKLTAANFGDVFMGLESPDVEVLERAHKLQNVRNPVAEAVKTINKNGLVVIGSFIIGFDNEKKGVGERLCALIEDTAIPVFMLNMLNALPNTNLWKRLEREGRLLNTTIIGESITGDRMNFKPTRPESEIFREMTETWAYLYEPSRFFARARRYFTRMRPTRAAMGVEKPPDTDRKTAKRARPSWRDRARLVRGFLRLLWMQGIRPPYRKEFWRNLYLVRRDNPSRLVQYLHSCGMGENMFRIREMLQEQLRAADSGGKKHT